MSQWPKWLRHQYGKLEICGLSPGYDTNFSLKNYQLVSSQWSLVTQQLQHVPWFLPWMPFGRPSLLAQWLDLNVRLVLRGRPEPGLQVWECYMGHCWKKRYTTDTLCPICAAIPRYVHPASRSLTMRPRSNGGFATTGTRFLGQSIAGLHSAPFWTLACENTRVHCRQSGYTVYWCLGTPYCDMCVSFDLNLLSYTPTCLAELILQPFLHFTYVTAHSPTLPLLYLRHSSFYNPSFASPTSQALHLIHLASRPWLFHASSNQCNLLFIFSFFQEKQLSLTKTIKYEINKYMFKFIIFNFFFIFYNFLFYFIYLFFAAK